MRKERSSSRKKRPLPASLGAYDARPIRSLTQEDPIGLAGGLNLYGFAGGDPVNFADPFGLSPLDCKKVKCPPVTQILKDRNFLRAMAQAFSESQADLRERGAYLFKNADGSIRVGPVVVGERGTVNLGDAPDDAIGSFHTHPDLTGPDPKTGQPGPPGGPLSGDDSGHAGGNNVNVFVIERGKVHVIRWRTPDKYETVPVKETP